MASFGLHWQYSFGVSPNSSDADMDAVTLESTPNDPKLLADRPPKGYHSPNTLAPCWEATAEANKQVDQENDHHYQQRHHSHVLPPHLPP